MIEVIQRERYEEYHKAVHTGRIVALALGADFDIVQRAEEFLEYAVFQTAWDPAAVRDRMDHAKRVAARERSARERDARLLAETASYSGDPDETPDTLQAPPVAHVNLKKTPGVVPRWDDKDK